LSFRLARGWFVPARGLTDGNTTEAVTVTMRSPLLKTARTGSPLGANWDRSVYGMTSI
jgi:hypothetical protein